MYSRKSESRRVEERLRQSVIFYLAGSVHFSIHFSNISRKPLLIFGVVTQMNNTMQELMFTRIKLKSARSTGTAEQTLAVAASALTSFLGPVLLPWLFPADVVLRVSVCHRDTCDSDYGRYLNDCNKERRPFPSRMSGVGAI